MWTANREGLSPTTNVQPFKISSANSWTGMMYASIKCCLVDKWAGIGQFTRGGRGAKKHQRFFLNTAVDIFHCFWHSVSLSSLYVIMWLFSTARWRTKSSTIKSSPQTACTTHFAHCLHLQTLCRFALKHKTSICHHRWFPCTLEKSKFFQEKIAFDVS